MARKLPALPSAALGAALFLGACGKSASGPDLVDAAALYAANKGLFQSIRAAYPGPYYEFTRIPARDPADATKSDKAFLSSIRNDLPVEFIDFFPIGNSGQDEIDVVLWRYETKGQWNTVSLVYFSEPMTFAAERQSVYGFESCGDEVRNWLNNHDGDGAASVFCRIDDNWHAYQQVQ